MPRCQYKSMINNSQDNDSTYSQNFKHSTEILTDKIQWRTFKLERLSEFYVCIGDLRSIRTLRI